MADSDAKPPVPPNITTFRWIILIIFILLLARLFWMQVLKYPDFVRGAISNKIRTIPQIAPRGQIFDRAGRPLAVNEPVFSLIYFPPMKGEKDVYLPEIARYLAITLDELNERIAKETKKRYRFQPIPIYDDLTLDQVTIFSEFKDTFAGIFVEENNYRRRYPYGAAVAHVIGYTGLINEENLALMLDYGYEREEFIGLTGVEKHYENILRGRPGKRDIEISKGQYKREINYIPPRSGNDIYLTIDVDVQTMVHKALRKRRGTVIISKPKTGEIIAMVSSPSFDPNRLRGAENADYATGIQNDTIGKPQFFRSISGKYAPGSTFKLVTALAGLETGNASENTQWTCTGKYKAGTRVFREHYTPQGHGPIVFKDAIGKSCDVAFWSLGVKIGPTKLGHYARMLGFGDRLGIDIDGEKTGRVPDKEYKLKHWKEDWFDGDTANMAIGQGFVESTPLQVLWCVNAIVTDGVVPVPHVLNAEMRGGELVSANLPQPKRLDISPNSTRIIREGMRRAVLYGTCKQLRNIGISCAGKTGTADVPHGEEPHAWFVGFFPYDNPEYSIVILLENAGKSSDSSVPLAGEIIKNMSDIVDL
ncbi:penicillin-binding protein 2 [bacterium]|nr:penicillin-binding protein 2 [bacterium]